MSKNIIDKISNGIFAKESFDIIERKIIICNRDSCLFFVDGLINDEVMEKIIEFFYSINNESQLSNLKAFCEKSVPYVEVSAETDLDKIYTGILSGIMALAIDGLDGAIMLDVRSYPQRDSSEPEKDKVLRGSHDGFVETLVANTALVRRRIRDRNLRMKYLSAGIETKTDIVLCYMDNKVDKKLLTEITQKVENASVEALTMTMQSLSEVIYRHKWYSPFPKAKNTERPLLYNLAELQNDCSKMFKISPDETLKVVQELYEKKMVTYPRTDARVLSTAVSKEIQKNIGGLKNYGPMAGFADEVLNMGSYKGIAKTRYVNDKQITDHYAIIPTGQGLGALSSVSATAAKVYEIIVRRFLSIFYPPAVYQKISLVINIKGERFFASFKVLMDEGYLKVTQFSFAKKKEETPRPEEGKKEGQENDGQEEDIKCDADFLKVLQSLKKGEELSCQGLEIREGETSPPKRYNSGTIILTMENAGQFVEDEELRAQIKGSGIGTSATRAEILKKLVSIDYLALNKKTQIITPTQMGEMIYDVVSDSIKPLLNPALTASWEKGLTMVAEGTITSDEYMKKLTDFVGRRTNIVKQLNNQQILFRQFDENAKYYAKQPARTAARKEDTKKEPEARKA